MEIFNFFGPNYQLHLFLFFKSTQKNKDVFLLSKTRTLCAAKASTGKVIKMSTESSNYESLEEKKKSGILFLTLQSQSDNLCLAEKIMSRERSLITLGAASLCDQTGSRSPAHPRSPTPECCCFQRTLGKLLNHGPPLGEQSGTSPYECTAAAGACRLNASAESLSGVRLYKKNDETEFLSWLEVSGCDPCVITSLAEPFLFPVACV